MTSDGKVVAPKKASKLWIYNSFGAAENPHSSYLVIRKIAKFDIRILDLSSQQLTFYQYQLLTASGTVEKVKLAVIEITDSNGFDVTFDKLFENLQNLKEFELATYKTIPFEADTVAKMIEILPRLKNLHQLKLGKLEENFDFSLFSEYLMKNGTVDVRLEFRGYGLSDAYKAMLETFIDKIMKNRPKQIPLILFPQLNKIKLAKYKKIFNRQYKI
uniref:Uncharacterized protein n=1 Tax=Panagrolaimus sp. ES5 TaxID=591445 RepID=A0AC34F1W2_9BILA